MSAPDFPVSCLATDRKVKMGWFHPASSVKSSYLSQGQRGMVLSMSVTWLSLCHVFPLTAR